MTDLNSRKNKHLTLEDRLEIQDGLNHGMAFKAIALRIGKDQTTLSKEVKKHLTVTPVPMAPESNRNIPAEKKPCPLLLKAPFVCNPCKKRHIYCSFPKQLYNAKTAQRDYESLLSEAREGIPLNKDEFYKMDAILSGGIKMGQHLYHILQTNQLNLSKSTAYRHLHRGYLSVNKLDFPRVVKFKARRQRKEDFISKSARLGRSHDDFLAFLEENAVSSWVEMDTVIGRVGGKVILTFDFTFCNFMFGLLLEDRTAMEVADKIRSLKTRLASNNIRFGDLFPLILTDNGGEFANVSAIEADRDGDRESRLYFCDPYQSSQKPKVEKNHTLFRDIVPKGQSFDSFSQETVNRIFSHVNSVTRKSLYGKTPFEIFSFTFCERTARCLGICPIPPNEVVQSPRLLKG